MSGYSNVGNSGVYEAGDQRNVKNSELPHAERYEEGQKHSHINIDSSKCPALTNLAITQLTPLQRMSDPSPTAWLPRR